jgi:teichuronic acid biosynthesis glycosyltransferase TuaH
MRDDVARRSTSGLGNTHMVDELQVLEPTLGGGPRRPLVWLAEVPFLGPPHRQAHLARYLRQRFDVLYVEPPPPLRLPAPSVSNVRGVKVAQVLPILNARPARLRSALAQPAIRRLASWLAVLQLGRAVRRGFSGRRTDELIVVCSNVFLARAALALRARALVVDICDDPRYYPGEPVWTAALLHTIVSRARLVTTSSLALRAEFSATFGARHVALVPNGVHATYLANGRADAWPPIGAPVGFVGYLGAWVDFDLLLALANALPDVVFELVGAIDPSVVPRAARLACLPNVRFRGPIPEADVPRALASFSVGLIPFVRGPYTRAVNPNKLYEYAAWNLPIVTTAFSPDVAQFGEHVDVCETTAAFVRAVSERAAGVGRRPTRWIAETHTWTAVAERFAELITRAADEPK